MDAGVDIVELGLLKSLMKVLGEIINCVAIIANNIKKENLNFKNIKINQKVLSIK